MNKVDRLLFRRERTGLLVSITVRLFVIIGIGIGHILSHHTKIEMYRVLISSLTLVLVECVCLFFIYRGKYFQTIGYANVIIDILILFFLPINWYLSVGGYEQTPLSYNLKSSIVILVFATLAISSLAIRAEYPAVIAIIFILSWEVLLQFVLEDPRTLITTSFIDTAMGPGVIVSYYRTPQLVVALVGGVLAYIVYSYRRSIYSAVNLEVSNSQMSRYFSPGVAERLANDMEGFTSLGGRNQKVAVLFCDIRDFTTISENMQPEQVMELLREYHSRMVEIIFKNDGTLDKFIGDGMMVTFGTPDPGHQDAINAVNAAIEMHRSLIELNQERKRNQKDPVYQGIGIHYGPVISGNIGTPNRLEYTVIGDTVNIASRIESACKSLNQSLLISHTVYQELQKSQKDFIQIEKLPKKVKLKGKSEPVQLYAIQI